MARPTRATFLAASVLLGALALSACGNGNGNGNDPGSMEGMDHGDSQSTTSTEPDPAADFNDADVMFAQMMIPHHEQAIEMSDIVLAHPDVMPEVSDLAQQIKDAQQPEIETLNGWLAEWGAEPAEGEMDHGSMGHDSGMMSEEDLAALEAASGDELNRLFLEQMTMHHEGAVAMAQDQVDNGQNPDAIALAEEIITTQEEEITTMAVILGTLNEMNS